MKSVTDFHRALMLQEWQNMGAGFNSFPNQKKSPGAKLYKEVVDGFVKRANVVIAKKGLFGEELRRAIPALAKNLSNSDVRIKLAAIYVLETLQQDAAPAAESVVVALRDKNAFVRWGAARVLGRMAPQKAKLNVPALAAVLSDKHAHVRVTAVAALKQYGREAKDTVPALTHLLKGNDRNVHKPAIEALVAIGKDAIAATSAIVSCLSSSEKDVRLAAVKALGRFGKADPAVVQGLRRSLSDADAEVRQAASYALLDLK